MRLLIRQSDTITNDVGNETCLFPTLFDDEANRMELDCNSVEPFMD